ncbi:MAG: phytanoyl-CoA dioxygenase family protein, partial [Pseudomonadota bacterium]
ASDNQCPAALRRYGLEKRKHLQARQILFSLPVSAGWSVPHDVWHVDVPRLGTPDLPGLQVFTFLETVAPQGGGTLIVAGSHRLANNSGVTRSKDLKHKLGRELYFRTLFNSERAPISDLSETTGEVDGVDLEIIELTGEVGDVYLMDLRTLHTPAPNASDTARIMLTCRFPKTAIASTLWNQDAMAARPAG